MKILVLGGTGMLGSAVTRHFSAYYDNVASTSRGQFDALKDNFDVLPTGFDYVINCIGVIKHFMERDPAGAIAVNALFPWRLAGWCEKSGAKLIHISTDCVYSGQKGKYVESDPHDALDAYGKTKSLGECYGRAMVLRTSIIGEEIGSGVSLLAWTKRQKGKTVGGYVNHFWNGVTTDRYAQICDQIIRGRLYETGLFHIYAADDVSKHDMLLMFDRRYNLGLSVLPKTPTPAIDRTLRTEKALCAKLNIPTVEQMINEMTVYE
ncbi:NAD(P)-dependent oxidoreductase [Synergistales bacterium]|nr:NAD(P)-dependent oxidoreductase [Synergistales bacterium]